MTTDVRIAFGAVSEIPVFPVTGSITKARDAPGIVVGAVGAAVVVVVVCAPTLPLTPSKAARQVTLLSMATRRIRALAFKGEHIFEVGVEVDTSDTEDTFTRLGKK